MAPKSKKTVTPKRLGATPKGRQATATSPTPEPAPQAIIPTVVQSTIATSTTSAPKSSQKRSAKKPISAKQKGKRKILAEEPDEEEEEDDLDAALERDAARDAEEEALRQKKAIEEAELAKKLAEEEAERIRKEVEAEEAQSEEDREEEEEEEEQEGSEEDEEPEGDEAGSGEDSGSEEEEEESPSPSPPPLSPKKRKAPAPVKPPSPKRTRKGPVKSLAAPVKKAAPTAARRKNAESPAYIQVNQSLPSSWFRDAETAGKWVDEFRIRKISCSDFLDVEFFEALKLPCFELLKNSPAWNLLNLETVYYPELTRLFYINLKAKNDTDGWSLESVVKGVRISLNSNDFADSLGLPTPVPPAEIHPSKENCIILARAKYLLPEASNNTSKQLTHSSLTLEAKIIFNIIVRCLLPRLNSGSLLTDNAMVLLYRILNGLDPDLANTILSTMAHARKARKGSPLPFATLLTPIFKASGINVKNEEQLRHTGMFDSKGLEKIGITRSPQGTLSLATPSKAFPTAPAFDERMDNLELGLEEVRLDIKELQKELMTEMSGISKILEGLWTRLTDDAPDD
jgi:hypothetical protein